VGLFSSFISSVTGGISDIVGAVAGGASQLLGAAAPIIQTVAPLAAPILSQFLGGRQQLDLARLQQQGLAGGAGGSQAVARANLLQPRSNIGFAGNQLPGANPITRAQFFPPFDPFRLPSRPVFGAIQRQNAQFPQFQFPQTTSFRQQGFGASLSPGFRPFQPSFRSGQFGTQGQFVPGVSQGFAPQFPRQQFQRGPAPVRPFRSVFNRFGGFGF